MRRWVLAETLRPALLVGAIAAVLVGVLGIYVYGWVATRQPELVDPHGFESAAEAAEIVAAMNPLFVASGDSAPVFVLLCALWAGVHAALLSVVATLSAILIRSRVIALILPTGMFFVISIATQMMNLPSMSPMIMWTYPGGLMPFDMVQGLVPGLVAGLGCAVLTALIMRRSPQMQRFA